MTVNLKLTFGPKLADVEYTTTHLAVLLTKERISNTINTIKEKTGLASVPTFLMELPNTFTDAILKSPYLQSLEMAIGLKMSMLNAGVKAFLTGELSEEVDFLKSIEENFKEITELNNDIELKLELSQPGGWVERFKKGKHQKKVGHPASTVMLEGGSIEGHIGTDPKLLAVLKKIFDGVCPQFNQSPIMAALQLFELVEADLKFHSFKLISDRLWKQFEETHHGKQHKTEDPFLQQLAASHEEMFVYITIPQLCCFKFRTPCNVLGAALPMLAPIN